MAANATKPVLRSQDTMCRQWVQAHPTLRVRVRIVVFGVADPPHSGRCLARATAEAVEIAPDPGIDPRVGPEIDLGAC